MIKKKEIEVFAVKPKNETPQQTKRVYRGVMRRVAAGLLITLVAFLVTLWVLPMTETVRDKTREGSADWMSRLPDGQSLGSVVLPGTHDSGTRFVGLAFFSKCQSLSIGEQLRAGYRYLDIRLSIDGDSMKLVHGFTNCKVGRKLWDKPLLLEAVLEECYTFLEEHPTETVVFAVKKENGKDDTAAFEKLVQTYVEKNPSRWLCTDRIPTVGEARGKLVLMRRYEDAAGLGADAGISFLWDDQGGNDDTGLNIAMTDNGTYRLWVQDRFEYADREKWEAFLGGLHSPDVGQNDVAVHFLSTKGTAKYGHPFSHARALNPRLLRLQSNELSGWIIVDFADAALAEKIYSANFD